MKKLVLVGLVLLASVMVLVGCDTNAGPGSTSGTTQHPDGNSNIVSVKIGEVETQYKNIKDGLDVAMANPSSTLILKSDINVSEPIEVTAGDFTLDLNGKSINVTATYAIIVRQNANLVIKDSLNSGGIYLTGDSFSKGVFNEGNLTMSVSSISVTADNSVGVYNENGGILNMDVKNIFINGDGSETTGVYNNTNGELSMDVGLISVKGSGNNSGVYNCGALTVRGVKISDSFYDFKLDDAITLICSLDRTYSIELLGRLLVGDVIVYGGDGFSLTANDFNIDSYDYCLMLENNNLVLREKTITTQSVTIVREKLIINEVELEKTSEIQVINSEVNSIKPFVMGQYEVTESLYKAVMGTLPDYGKGDLYPVVFVNWYDAVAFCNKLSGMMELEPVYSVGGETDPDKWVIPRFPEVLDITCNWDALGYRLPTEEEWELAARGGNPQVYIWNYTYAGGNEIETLGWYSGNSDEDSPHEVGLLASNSLGLYDMSGNVSEWCWDSDTTGESRVYRGGDYMYDASYCELSKTNIGELIFRLDNIGFRIVRTVQ